MTHTDNNDIGSQRVVDDGSWVLNESKTAGEQEQARLTSDQRGATGTVSQPLSQYSQASGTQGDSQGTENESQQQSGTSGQTSK